MPGPILKIFEVLTHLMLKHFKLHYLLLSSFYRWEPKVQVVKELFLG